MPPGLLSHTFIKQIAGGLQILTAQLGKRGLIHDVALEQSVGNFVEKSAIICKQIDDFLILVSKKFTDHRAKVVVIPLIGLITNDDSKIAS